MVSVMAIDLEALRREVNAAVGCNEEAAFFYFPAQNAVTYLQWAFCDDDPFVECCDREKLVRMVIPLFEREAERMNRLISVLKRYAAGDV